MEELWGWYMPLNEADMLINYLVPFSSNSKFNSYFFIYSGILRNHKHLLIKTSNTILPSNNMLSSSFKSPSDNCESVVNILTGPNYLSWCSFLIVLKRLWKAFFYKHSYMNILSLPQDSHLESRLSTSFIILYSLLTDTEECSLIYCIIWSFIARMYYRRISKICFLEPYILS